MPEYKQMQPDLNSGVGIDGSGLDAGLPSDGIVPSPAEQKAPGIMASSEMKADINNDLSDLESKRGAANTQEYISQNKIESAKADLVRAIFDILKSVGVDPTDLGSIQNFINQLEQSDPDLLRLFNYAFETLTGMPEAQSDIAKAAENTSVTMPEPAMSKTPGEIPNLPGISAQASPLSESPMSGGQMPGGINGKFSNIPGMIK